MKRRALSLGSLLLLAGHLVAAAPYDLKEPSEAEVARMEAAMPAAPTVPPARPRRILVFSQCEGFKHTSVPYVEKAFEILGRKTGAFTTYATIDSAIFESPELDTFDAIVMNNTTMRLPLLQVDDKDLGEAGKAALAQRELAARQRFLDFVRNGKGLIGVHAATDCFYDWPEYAEMIGGLFNAHPWNEDVTVKLDDPGHPLLRAFRGQSYVVADEIYQFKEPYSRDRLRVLMSLDTARTNMNKKDIRRTDGDFAVAWLQRSGQGRVFYYSLGHRHDIFWNEAIMRCYLDGIQYALGDLACDDTPSNQLSEAYLAESRKIGYEQGIEAVFADLADYRMGENDQRARLVDRMVLEVQPEGSPNRSDLSARLARLAADPRASLDGRVHACRQLVLIGEENAVPALASLLGDADLGLWARRALEAIPGPAVDTALVQALGQTTGLARAGVMDSLGKRGVGAAVAPLARFLALPDAPAAAQALGKIGGAQAIAALQAAQPVDDAARLAVAAGLLACADAARAAGRADEAAGAYGWLLAAGRAPEHVQGAAFYGMAMCHPERGLTAALGGARMERLEIVRAAASVARDLPGDQVAAAFSDILPGLPAAVQPYFLDALAIRGDRAAQPMMLELALAPDETVRIAAYEALGKLGDALAVPVLVAGAVQAENDKLAQTARQALAVLAADNVDLALIAALAAGEPAAQAEIVRALGTRKAKGAVPALLRTARSENRDLARESRRSLAVLAAPADLPEIVALLAEQTAAGSRGEIETILVAVARQIEGDGARTAAILPALAGELPVKARASLLDVLGRIGAESGLPALYAALDDAGEDVQLAAVRTLAENWPDAAPMPRLREISLNAGNQVLRVLSLRGYARMLAMPSRRPMRETLGLYEEALKLAKGEQEKRTLVTGLGDLCHPDALAFVKPYLDDPAVRDEALLAALKITQALDGQGMVFKASHGQGAERNAVDGTRDTRWTSGKAMEPGMWFQVDLGYETNIEEIWLDAGPVGNDQPRGYEVYVSLDGETWGNPVIAGGDPGQKVFTITLPAAYGRYAKIVQTGGGVGNFWSIAEMRVNGRPSASGKAELDRANWQVSASRSAGDAPAANAIDGDRQKRWGTGAPMRETDWFQIDLGETKTVYRIVLDAAGSGSDFPRQVRVDYSLDGETWTGPIGATEGERAVTPIVLLPTQARYLRIRQTGSHDTYWWSIYDIKVFGE